MKIEIENNIAIADEKRVAELTNKYFKNIIKNLNSKAPIINAIDDIQPLTKSFENHISIRKIKEAYLEIVTDSFHFKSMSLNDVKKEVLNLNPKKSSTSGTILVIILKQTIDVHLQYLTNVINYALQTNRFPHKLKQSKVIPVYNKLDPLEKKNYRPGSLLPHVSKVFERIIYKHINTYTEEKISNYITGFRKSHGNQNSLVILLERWKQAIDKGEYISVMYMDLSKAFNTVNHDLLLAKLRAYGFSTSTLNLLCSYLKNRKQKVVINNKTSSSKVVTAGVPQGSIDGLLRLILFINNLFLFLYTTVLSNYADDNNLYAIGNDKEETKRALVEDLIGLMKTIWF